MTITSFVYLTNSFIFFIKKIINCIYEVILTVCSIVVSTPTKPDNSNINTINDRPHNSCVITVIDGRLDSNNNINTIRHHSLL
ncbi:hypothetical protein LXL04_036850 [Taraxacum kok-saghyz]